MSAHEIRHPLIRHKLGLMRRTDISTKNFRELAQELGTLLTYEATKDLPLETHAIDGWSGVVEVEKIAGKKITVVPFTSQLEATSTLSNQLSTDYGDFMH